LGIGFATGLVALVAAAPQSPTSQTQPPATPPATTPPVTAPPTTTAPQTPTPPAPATPPPAAEPRATGPPVPRTFTSDAGIIFSAIKPEKAADFEAIMTRVKDALAKSTNPKRRQQAAAWRVFKSVEPGPGGTILYLSFFDPPVKDEEYSVSTILSEAFPEEAQALWRRYMDCFVDGQTLVNLKLAVAMSAIAAAK
jgi:hypothetical protein